MFDLNVNDANITFDKNSNIFFYGKCEIKLLIYEWGDTGTIEMRKQIEKSKCYWSVKVNEEIDLKTERGLRAKDFEQKVRSLKFDCLGYLTYSKDIDSTNIEVFLSKKSLASFQYLIEKFIMLKNSTFLISSDEIIELSSLNEDSQVPTLEDFYSNKVGILVSDISFTLKQKTID